ncbi:MAG: CPBP family intramembrane metalloprotease [Gammaproteobacteria bacterium]|nr:CPBP family intramembrane metalloprotease [Gammaproteobacteria bacterium]
MKKFMQLTPLSPSAIVVNHFYIGVLITVFYVMAGPIVVSQGFPGIAPLLLAELFILTPVGMAHLLFKAKSLTGRYDLSSVIVYTNKISARSMILWSLGGILLVILVYVPLYPVGMFFRTSVFAWLPEWYFNPGFGSTDAALIAKIFLAGIFVDGLVGPIIEELFFRGYLLARMEHLKGWAPVLNGALFGIYHFWQPHNLLAIIGVGIVLSYVVWKTKNVYLGIIIHCTINLLGAIGGYMAVSEGLMLSR